ncbi:MAG: transposase, partial [Alphaproteobacteria bacterium]|nr:transposase [Alphaproteobacteria bacterium]
MVALAVAACVTQGSPRHVLDARVKRGRRKPQVLIVDGGTGREQAPATLWGDVPTQRCTVHKHRNLLAHTPPRLH